MAISKNFSSDMPPLRNQLRQRLPMHELHRDEMNTLGFFDGVDVNDVGVVERRNRLSFPLETVPAFFGVHLPREDLEGYVPVELRVLGDIDLTHTATADFLVDLVVGKWYGPPTSSSYDLDSRGISPLHPGS